jgi:hypothetical protein
MHVSRPFGFEPVVLEHVLLRPFEGNRLEEPRRHDAVGVDVLAPHRQRAPFDDLDFSAAITAPRGNFFNQLANVRDDAGDRAAATIAGLISSVRPVGLPAVP